MCELLLIKLSSKASLNKFSNTNTKQARLAALYTTSQAKNKEISISTSDFNVLYAPFIKAEFERTMTPLIGITLVLCAEPIVQATAQAKIYV